MWWKTKRDSALFALLQSLPSLPFGHLVRHDRRDAEENKRAFFERGVPPRFSYPKADAFDVQAYVAALERCRQKMRRVATDQHVLDLYLAKLDELETRARIVRAIQKRDDASVHQYSRGLYGNPAQSAETLAREFEKMCTHASTFHKHSRPISGPMLKVMIERVVAYYDISGVHVRLFSGRTIKIGYGTRQDTSVVYVPKERMISRARAARLLTHEIEVHLLRSHNGQQSDIALLGRGLDRYLATEEGLAVYCQNRLFRKPRQHAPGFWDAWAVAMTERHTFSEIFRRIATAKRELATPKGGSRMQEDYWEEAWRLCLRVYRGIHNPAQVGVGFLRDHIYRSGALWLEQTIEEYGEDETLALLFTGKIGIQHIPPMQKMHIPVGKLPDFVSKKIVKEVRREAKRGEL